ncbi:UDP-glycosyltransferase 76B1-like [Nymphaea colorata]|nr:UDP-glycosyltransferase 76B1-like [Nymphaea colorata]
MEGRRAAAPHLALFPFPLQGHITPMLQLAHLLHSRGFSITIVHARYNAPDHTKHPQFRFEPFADGIEPDQFGAMGILEMLSTIVDSLKQPFRSVMGRIQSGQNRVDCVVSDALAYFSRAVAQELGLPWLVFRTSSPTSFMFFAAFPSLRQMGYIPVQDSELESVIKEKPPFRVKDLPLVKTGESESFFQFIGEMVEATKKSSALVLNSMDKLEQPTLDSLRSEIPAPIYVLGPLCNYASGDSGSLIRQDRSCLSWLDKQASGTVMYVSIGSVARMDAANLTQMAQGLRDSRQPFLWVIRPGLVRSEDSVQLLDQFVEESQDMGRVVKWAPQSEVLAHPAVGGFMTHCGWNSTLECICAGKPMICWPAYGDQMVNARLVCQVWSNGVEMGEKLESEKMKNSIKELLMGEEKGKKMREKARLLQQLVLESMKTGGSSYESTSRFIDHISSLIPHSSDSF